GLHPTDASLSSSIQMGITSCATLLTSWSFALWPIRLHPTLQPRDGQERADRVAMARQTFSDCSKLALTQAEAFAFCPKKLLRHSKEHDGKTQLDCPRGRAHMEWYVARDGQSFGPFPFSRVVDGARSGELHRDDLVAKLDAMIKATGHRNCYFPIFIPIDLL